MFRLVLNRIQDGPATVPLLEGQCTPGRGLTAGAGVPERAKTNGQITPGTRLMHEGVASSGKQIRNASPFLFPRAV
jgi:hypothetical protein